MEIPYNTGQSGLEREEKLGHRPQVGECSGVEMDDGTYHMEMLQTKNSK